MTNCNMYVCHNKFNKNEQNVAVQLLTDVVKHAKSDHLGRKPTSLRTTSFAAGNIVHLCPQADNDVELKLK